MRYFSLTIALVLAACGGGNSSRWFRVLIPSTSGTQPDSCYQAATLPAASSLEQSDAEDFCDGRKKPSASGMTNNAVVAQEWSVSDVGGGKLYLVIANGTSMTGVEGLSTPAGYAFTFTSSGFEKDCPGAAAGVVECGGACVNTRSDATNCGACGATCPTGMACRFGACTDMCPAIMVTCGGTLTNTQNDNANCGICGNACTMGRVCSGGNCVAACAATCSDRYSSADCPMPRTFTRTNETKVDLSVTKGVVSGTLNGNTSYSCAGPSCTADLAERCPVCATSVMLSGIELTGPERP